MSVQNIKNNIINSINGINGFNFSILYVESVSVVEWNQFDQQETEKFVDDTLDILNKLKNNISVLDSVPINYINELKNNLEQVVTNYNNNLANLTPNQITSQHHGVLNYFSTLINILRNTGLYTQLKLVPDFEDTVKKLKEANSQLKNFNIESFEKASSLVDELIQKKVSFEDKTIKESLGTFLNRANEHKIKEGGHNIFSKKFWKGQWLWLFGAIILGGLVAYTVYTFTEILKIDKDITLGVALLRISSLVIPSYFMIFFLSQFSYHKRMYEIYSFKNTSLNIMTDLMKTNQDKSDDILKRGLDVLFTEPEIKEGGKYDKQLVSDLLNFVKDKIK